MLLTDSRTRYVEEANRADTIVHRFEKEGMKTAVHFQTKA